MEKDLFIKPKDLSIKLSTQNNLKILDATFYLPDSVLIEGWFLYLRVTIEPKW